MLTRTVATWSTIPLNPQECTAIYSTTATYIWEVQAQLLLHTCPFSHIHSRNCKQIQVWLIQIHLNRLGKMKVLWLQKYSSKDMIHCFDSPTAKCNYGRSHQRSFSFQVDLSSPNSIVTSLTVLCLLSILRKRPKINCSSFWGVQHWPFHPAHWIPGHPSSSGTIERACPYCSWSFHSMLAMESFPFLLNQRLRLKLANLK